MLLCPHFGNRFLQFFFYSTGEENIGNGLSQRIIYTTTKNVIFSIKIPLLSSFVSLGNNSTWLKSDHFSYVYGFKGFYLFILRVFIGKYIVIKTIFFFSNKTHVSISIRRHFSMKYCLMIVVESTFCLLSSCVLFSPLLLLRNQPGEFNCVECLIVMETE